MSVNRLTVSIIPVIASVLFYGTAALANEAACESNAAKASAKTEFKVATLRLAGDKIEVTPACSHEVMTIRSCTLVGIKKKGRQKYCYPEGKPAYFEIYDVIEYYVE